MTQYVNELYGSLYARSFGMETIGLRYFNVFGPRQDPDGPYAAVMPKWIDAMRKHRPVFINGDGKEVGRKVGYGGGGPKGVIEEIEKAKSK